MCVTTCNECIEKYNKEKKRKNFSENCIVIIKTEDKKQNKFISSVWFYFSIILFQNKNKKCNAFCADICIKVLVSSIYLTLCMLSAC